jgi:hypothetical protein
MREVSVGDRLQVILPDGSVGYEDVYLLTHKDAVSVSQYVRITLASGRQLTLSPRHFVPTAPDADRPDWQSRVFKGADEIGVGDVLWFHDGERMQPARVAGIAREVEYGAFNPLTLTGTIVVDGVVASAHSDWFLDGIVSADAQARGLPGDVRTGASDLPGDRPGMDARDQRGLGRRRVSLATRRRASESGLPPLCWPSCCWPAAFYSCGGAGAAMRSPSSQRRSRIGSAISPSISTQPV